MESARTYEAGITRTCDENNKAKLVTIEFTTSAIKPCNEVIGVVAVPAKYSVSLEWNGDGIAYNVRFREAGTTNWTQRQVETVTI